MVLLELFVFWPLVLLGVPLVVSAARPVERRRAFAELSLFVGPMLVSLMLLHAVFASVPNNSAVRSEYGFFGFWFHPARLFDLERHRQLYMGLALAAVLPALFALVVTRRLVDRARGVQTMVVAFLAQILTAMALYLVPSRLLDAANHRPEVLDSWERFSRSLLDELQPAILATVLLGAVALAATLRSLQPEER